MFKKSQFICLGLFFDIYLYHSGKYDLLFSHLIIKFKYHSNLFCSSLVRIFFLKLYFSKIYSYDNFTSSGLSFIFHQNSILSYTSISSSIAFSSSFDSHKLIHVFSISKGSDLIQ